MTSLAAVIPGGGIELRAILPGASQDSPLVRFAAAWFANTKASDMWRTQSFLRYNRVRREGVTEFAELFSHCTFSQNSWKGNDG
jgi:hypothetical protein